MLIYPRVKRAFDSTLVILALPLIAPTALLVSVAIWATSGMPVLYRGSRAGLGGLPFTMYKFRTMVRDAERRGGTSSAADDARITPVGRLLRAWKLDELPQLLNVLKGDMSLVGPRPQVLDEVAAYTEEERGVLSVKPGITDYASIRFRNEGEILQGHADPDEAYRVLIRGEKMRLGLMYARHASLWVDARILVDTAFALVGIPMRRSPSSDHSAS